MNDLISNWLNSVLESICEFANGIMIDLVNYIFHIELLPVAILNGELTEDMMTRAYNYVMIATVTLVTLKFLWKGFEVYILWRDGDAEVNPKEMVTGTCQAIVTMIAFPTLYNYLANATVDFSGKIMNIFGQTVLTNISLAGDAALGTAMVAELLFVLVYFVVFIVFYVKLLARGWELFVQRLGFPIACVGLIDSDKGVFKGYVQILFKAAFTTIVQVLLMSLSLRFVITMKPTGLVAGASLLMSAFSIPALLQQILASQGHGGVGQKISSTAMFASNVKRLIGK
jgi:hypothetical protein